MKKRKKKDNLYKEVGEIDVRDDESAAKIELNIEEMTAIVVDAAFHLHKDLRPGLLEMVYESLLAKSLERRGLIVERQKIVTFEFDGLRFDEGLRIDLLVNGLLVVELKSVETLIPVHYKQVLTYLRLMDLPLGLLINFGSAAFKEGCKRVANNHTAFTSSRLSVNQKEATYILSVFFANFAASREQIIDYGWF